MKWIIEWRERCTVLRFEGDLVVGATQFFETGLMPWLKTPFIPILLDLSDLRIIASAGLSALVKLRHAVEATKIPLVVVRPSREAWQVLTIARFDHLFEFVDSAEQGVARLEESVG